jgi:hypothetical protein
VSAGAYLAAARLAEALPLWALAAKAAQAERLKRADASALDRIRFKRGLALELAAGRLALPEAIARCRRYLDEEAPEGAEEAQLYGRDVLRTLPGDSEDERCGLNLIRLVRVELRDTPSVAREAVARLEKELQEYLAAKGGKQARP